MTMFRNRLVAGSASLTSRGANSAFQPDVDLYLGALGILSPMLIDAATTRTHY